MYQKSKIIDAHVHLMSLLYTQDIKHPKENPLDGDCVKNILKRMDQHGIDQAIGLVAQGISDLPLENDLTIKIAEALPDRFPAVMVGFSQPPGEPWNYDSRKAAEEIEGYLKHPVVKGLGEFAMESVSYMAEWPVVWDRLRPVFDVLAGAGACALFHTGVSPFFSRPENGERARARRSLYFSNPLFLDDIATEYPEVPLIIGHCGVQAYFYYGSYADMALILAARHRNVYLETSSVPFEVLKKAVADPAIGPEKLIFGSDSPAFYYHYTAENGNHYPTYGKTGPGNFQPDHYKYDLANIEKLPITENDKMMILGGTIARLFKLYSQRT